jgi:hypothetical protein
VGIQCHAAADVLGGLIVKAFIDCASAAGTLSILFESFRHRELYVSFQYIDFKFSVEPCRPSPITAITFRTWRPATKCLALSVSHPSILPTAWIGVPYAFGVRSCPTRMSITFRSVSLVVWCMLQLYQRAQLTLRLRSGPQERELRRRRNRKTLLAACDLAVATRAFRNGYSRSLLAQHQRHS